MKKPFVMKLAAGLAAAASVPFLWAYGAYRWALWKVDHPSPGEMSSIAIISGEADSLGIIGGADGPTSIFVTVGSAMEVHLVIGLALLAAAAGLWLLAKKTGKKQG